MEKLKSWVSFGLPDRGLCVIADVGGKAEFRAAAKDTGKLPEEEGREEAARPVPLLRPWVREEHEGARQACGRKPVQERQHIIGMKPETPLKLAGFHCRQSSYDPVNIRLRAYEAGMRIVPGLPDQMLARAETYFEPDFTNRSAKKRVQPPIRRRLA